MNDYNISDYGIFSDRMKNNEHFVKGYMSAKNLENNQKR